MPTSRDEAYWKTYSTLLLQLKGLIEAGNANLLKPQPFVELLETHIRNSKDLADLNDWWHTGRPDKLYLDSQHPTVALKLMVDLCEKMRKSTKGGPVVELENLVRESELSCESIFEAARLARERAAKLARQRATDATKPTSAHSLDRSATMGYRAARIYGFTSQPSRDRFV